MNKSLWGRSRDFPDTEPATVSILPPGEEAAYAETQPQPLADVRATAAAALAVSVAALEATPYDLMALARKDRRACPQPIHWVAFYRLLEQLSAGARLPPPPLIGPAWVATPASAKRMCFREQVEWAVANRCVHAAHQFLGKLREADWHYLG